MKQYNCPSCAAELDRKVAYSKIVICQYCQSSVFIDDEGARQAGKMSALDDMPSILELGRTFEYRKYRFLPVGRVRYDYGRGWWDEWWCYDDLGNTKWVSVDEGNIAMEETTDFDGDIPLFEDVRIGDTIKVKLKDSKEEVPFVVTEKNSCKCIGGEGELPFEFILGETYNFLDLSASKGRIFTMEYFSDSVDCYEGVWVDPFELKAL